ncbi:MAG: hypothetical protein JNJ90_01375 [Saprospiraceae bacterium]|jgi:hypothetical protein|nr:hypothetical protein [Saprospiraceae bacterium]
MFDLAKKYVLDLILANEEVKKFPEDFVTTSMKWIRSWFLIDGDPVVKTVLDSPGNEAVTTALVEKELSKLLKNETFKQELEAWIAEYATQKQKIKNVMKNTDMDIQGNVHIGDRGNFADVDYDQKNIVKGSNIKTGSDFRLGDEVV